MYVRTTTTARDDGAYNLYVRSSPPLPYLSLFSFVIIMFYLLFFPKHQIIVGDRDPSKTRIPHLVKPTVCAAHTINLFVTLYYVFHIYIYTCIGVYTYPRPVHNTGTRRTRVIIIITTCAVTARCTYACPLRILVYVYKRTRTYIRIHKTIHILFAIFSILVYIPALVRAILPCVYIHYTIIKKPVYLSIYACKVPLLVHIYKVVFLYFPRFFFRLVCQQVVSLHHTTTPPL